VNTAGRAGFHDRSGVPKEVKTDEYRVAIVDAVRGRRKRPRAGTASSSKRGEGTAAANKAENSTRRRAEILPDGIWAVWKRFRTVVKVKSRDDEWPLNAGRTGRGSTYFHFAATGRGDLNSGGDEFRLCRHRLRDDQRDGRGTLPYLNAIERRGSRGNVDPEGANFSSDRSGPRHSGSVACPASPQLNVVVLGGGGIRGSETRPKSSPPLGGETS